VRGEVAVAHIGADAHAAIRERVDAIERQSAYVDQELGMGDAQPHVIDEIGAGAEDCRPGVAADALHRTHDIGRPLIGEGRHDAASRIVATMFT
jgi:hypothetical protein